MHNNPFHRNVAIVPVLSLCMQTCRVRSVSDAQGGGVGVDAISDHAIEHSPVPGNLVTGQQSYDARVSMVELNPSIIMATKRDVKYCEWMDKDVNIRQKCEHAIQVHTHMGLLQVDIYKPSL